VDTSDTVSHWPAVIGRALAFLCLAEADLRDKGLAAQGQLLLALGLSRKDAAALLGTSPASLTELFRQAKNKGARRAKAKNRKK